MVTVSAASSMTDTPIPDNDPAGISDDIILSSSGITGVEYVEVNVEMTHEDAGNLEIVLVSPDTTESVLSESHPCYSSSTTVSCSYFNTQNIWRFGSARHMDETADGTWTIIVRDMENSNTGTLHGWDLKLYGR
jgi:subtilisin-like proprotein convertase family protein